MICALRVPDVRLAVARLAEPGLRERPLVLGGYPWERGSVSCLSAEAEEAGVRLGMSLRQAWQICPQAHFAPVAEREAALLWDELTWNLYRVSPDLEPVWPDRFHLRLDRVETLHGGLRGGLHEVDLAVRRVLHQRPLAAMSRSRFAAGVALAQAHEGSARRIPAGGERAFLAGFGVRTLPLSPETLAMLEALGLRTLGDVARLPVRSLVQRFGREGREAGRLARGDDGDALSAWQPPVTQGRRVAFEFGLEDRGSLAMALRRAAVELGETLSQQGLGAEGLTVRFELEGAPVVRAEKILRSQARGPEELARPAAALADHPGLDHPVLAVTLGLLQVRAARGRQLSLLVRHDGVREDVETAAARLGDRDGGVTLWRLQTGDPDSLLASRRAGLVAL